MQSQANAFSTAASLLASHGLKEAVITKQTGSFMWELNDRWGHIYTTGPKFGVTEFNQKTSQHDRLA